MYGVSVRLWVREKAAFGLVRVLAWFGVEGVRRLP